MNQKSHASIGVVLLFLAWFTVIAFGQFSYSVRWHGWQRGFILLLRLATIGVFGWKVVSGTRNWCVVMGLGFALLGVVAVLQILLTHHTGIIPVFRVGGYILQSGPGLWLISLSAFVPSFACFVLAKERTPKISDHLLEPDT